MIDALSNDVAPVRRLWRPSTRLTLWIAAQVALCIYVFSSNGIRGDIQPQLASPLFASEIPLLILSIVFLAVAAITAAVPGSERWGLARLGLATMLAALALLALHPVDTSLSIDTFVGHGFPCAVSTAMLSVLPTIWLLVATLRGFPLAPSRAGLIGGAAGFLVGFTMMRFLCILDDPLHVLAWHWLPVLLGSAVSAAVATLLAVSRRRYAPA